MEKKYSGVADTLFIPLVARIYASKKFPTYFYDAKSLELEGVIPSEVIAKKSSQYALIASTARYFNYDEMIRAFVKKNGECNVINLGCGLETCFFRLNEPRATFYEVDLPEVIASREKVLGSGEKEILLAYSLFDLEWTERVDKSKPSLMIVSGVFQYFHEEEILDFIHGVSKRLPGAELIFDYTNSTGIKYTNKYVQKTGNKDAMMYFYIDDENAFAEKAGVDILELRVFFTQARKMIKKGANLYTRIAMWVCDKDKRATILHVKLK